MASHRPTPTRRGRRAPARPVRGQQRRPDRTASVRRGASPTSGPAARSASAGARTGAPRVRAPRPDAQAPRAAPGAASKVPPERLLALDRLEQRLEVPLAEAARPVPLDHLEEERRPILRRPREDLQEVALLVAVGQDPEACEVVPARVDVPDTGGRVL